jgi:hypothetical protein
MDQSDILNVLRGGRVAQRRLERGTWRYRLETNRMAVVIWFVDENELEVVTGWRMKPRTRRRGRQ